MLSARVDDGEDNAGEGEIDDDIFVRFLTVGDSCDEGLLDSLFVGFQYAFSDGGLVCTARCRLRFEGTGAETLAR